MVIFRHTYRNLDSNSMNFKTFMFLTINWSIWTLFYNTAIKVQPFFFLEPPQCLTMSLREKNSPEPLTLSDQRTTCLSWEKKSVGFKEHWPLVQQSLKGQFQVSKRIQAGCDVVENELFGIVHAGKIRGTAWGAVPSILHQTSAWIVDVKIKIFIAAIAQ